MAACTSAASRHDSSRGPYVIHTVQASLNSSGSATAGGGSGGHFGKAEERDSGDK